jgi:NADH-quinone oxidoreductase subunit C
VVNEASETGAATRALEERFGEDVLETHAFRGDETVVVRPDRILEILSFLREDDALSFDFLADLCGVHYPEKAHQFEVVYHLYSFRHNRRLRVKARVADEGRITSVTSVYPSADWPEREAYDMVGIHFEGHPDLRRILMPEGFEGHPLRRDYPLTG